MSDEPKPRLSAGFWDKYIVQSQRHEKLRRIRELEEELRRLKESL